MLILIYALQFFNAYICISYQDIKYICQQYYCKLCQIAHVTLWQSNLKAARQKSWMRGMWLVPQTSRMIELGLRTGIGIGIGNRYLGNSPTPEAPIKQRTLVPALLEALGLARVICWIIKYGKELIWPAPAVLAARIWHSSSSSSRRTKAAAG